MPSLRSISTAAALATAAVAVPLPEAAPKCVEGVMIVAARPSDTMWLHPNETDPRFADIGLLQNMGDAVIQAVGRGSYLKAVPYPASGDFAQYDESLGLGIDAAQQMIMNYVDQCTGKVQNPRVVVLGFSQGANVISDALAGGDGRANLDKYKEHIIAGAIFADPSFVAGVEPLDAGNSQTSGRLPKTTAQENYLNTNYGQKLRSYCETGDGFCASGNGPNNITIHDAETQTFLKPAEAFLVATVNAVFQ